MPNIPGRARPGTGAEEGEETIEVEERGRFRSDTPRVCVVPVRTNTGNGSDYGDEETTSVRVKKF